MIFLRSLPISYKSFRDTILCNRDALTIEYVYDTPIRTVVHEDGLIVDGGYVRGKLRSIV